MKKTALTILLGGITLLSSCSKDDVIVENTPVIVSDRIDGVLPLTNERVLSVTNGIGPIIVDWGGDSTRIRWFMSRQVSVVGGEREARAQLNSIQLARHLNGDTAKFVSQYPSDMSKFSYSTLLSLGIPYRMKVYVDGVSGSAWISNLGGDVYVRNAHAVRVIGLNASCDIASIDGGDTVQVAIPAGGFCYITALKGNIFLNVPTSTSANVAARAVNGSVSYSNLSFIGLTQTHDSLAGKLGGGNGQVRLRTGEGSIVIQGIPSE